MKKIISAITACAVIGTTVSSALTVSAAEEYVTGTYDVLTYREYTDHIEICGCEDLRTELEFPSQINGLPVTVISAYACQYDEFLTSVTISEGVEEIRENAFYHCMELKNVTLPDSLTVLGEWAFSWCTQLEGITIPENVSVIDSYAFATCYELKDVKISDGVTAVGKSAFSFCSALTDIVFPKTVQSIDDYALECCYSMKKIVFLNPQCSISSLCLNDDYGGIICGYSGSTAQIYAEELGYDFKAIDNIGDVNLDGAVDSSDASLVLTEYSAVSTQHPSTLSETAKANADVNSDNTVDSSDASGILSYYAYTATGGTGTIIEFLQ